MKSLIELNVNLDRVVEALERQALAQERLVELLDRFLKVEVGEPPEEPAGLEALSQLGKRPTEEEQRQRQRQVRALVEDLTWKDYAPRGGRSDG